MGGSPGIGGTPGDWGILTYGKLGELGRQGGAGWGAILGDSPGALGGSPGLWGVPRGFWGVPVGWGVPRVSPGIGGFPLD